MLLAEPLWGSLEGRDEAEKTDLTDPAANKEGFLPLAFMELREGGVEEVEEGVGEVGGAVTGFVISICGGAPGGDEEC